MISIAMLRRIALPGLVVAVAGCAERSFVYRPVEQATATMDGQAAARYLVPPEAPRGDVRIGSFGVMDVAPQDEAAEVTALHVRMVVSNDSDTGPWSIDTRSLRAELRGVGDAGVPMVNAEAEALPMVEVPPGQQRTINLFYPLPEGLADAEDVPAFDLVWQVQTASRLVTERTPFERMEIEPRPAPRYGYYGYGPGWYGPYWWYDPWFYPPGVVVRPGFVVRPGIPASRWPGRVIVRPHRRR